VGKPFDQANVVFIPTASVAAGGHHGWLVEDLNRVYALGWREFNMLELNGLPRQMVLDRLRHADVIYAEGGNPYHLARSIIANGFFDWYLKPHLHSLQVPNRDDAWLAGLGKKVSFPIYAIDDQSAVRVGDGEVDVVSEGLWRIVNG
jgi:dipeptidase E